VTKPVDTEKSVPDGFFLTSNVHKIHFRLGLCPGPLWGSLRRLYMLVKVPVWFNLVLLISSIWSLKVLEFDFDKWARVPSYPWQCGDHTLWVLLFSQNVCSFEAGRQGSPTQPLQCSWPSWQYGGSVLAAVRNSVILEWFESVSCVIGKASGLKSTARITVGDRLNLE